MNIAALLNKIGVYSTGWATFLEVAIIVVLLGLLAVLVYYFTKKVISRIILKFIRKTPARWDDVFFNKKFFSRMGFLLAAIVIGIILVSVNWNVPKTVSRLAGVWITIAAVLMISEVLYGINRIYEAFSQSKDRPIKIIIQVIVIFMWCVAVLVVISIFTDRNIGALLAGMTAFAALIMLLFKDAILGFVAGIQLSANNMVRIGDWIEVPARGVDGTVTEINLTTVKVQNWDKTITTIPTYNLVSESFTNWRGMEESEGRRIKRSVNIDINTIHYLTDEELNTLRRSSLLNNYIENKLAEFVKLNEDRSSMLLHERKLTNLGVFREYLFMILENNPAINLDMPHMVRQLQTGPTGVPIEVYCFSKHQKWPDYERVQADIFDHIFAVIPLFGLKAFQYSGTVVTPVK